MQSTIKYLHARPFGAGNIILFIMQVNCPPAPSRRGIPITSLMIIIRVMSPEGRTARTTKLKATTAADVPAKCKRRQGSRLHERSLTTDLLFIYFSYSSHCRFFEPDWPERLFIRRRRHITPHVFPRYHTGCSRITST